MAERENTETVTLALSGTAIDQVVCGRCDGEFSIRCNDVVFTQGPNRICPECWAREHLTPAMWDRRDRREFHGVHFGFVSYPDGYTCHECRAEIVLDTLDAMFCYGRPAGDNLDGLYVYCIDCAFSADPVAVAMSQTEGFRAAMIRKLEELCSEGES